MNKKLLTILVVAGTIGGTFLIFNNYLRPEFGNAQIITHEYNVGGERVIINEQPPTKDRLFGADISVFKPEVKLEKWGDETWIKVWTDDPVEDTATFIDNKVISKSKDGKREYHLYPTTISQDGREIEGFEYEIILNEKPDTNIITLKIENQGLNFYYQPPLNQEKQEEGLTCSETECKDKDGIVVNYRPENVVGSYAVYHSTKQGDYSKMGLKNYRAGKAFHIYRPKIVDAAGKEVWGLLNIENDILSVEIPQEFLDNAIYPIIVDPTFGQTSDGGSDKGLEDSVAGSHFSAPEDGSVTSITAFMKSTEMFDDGYTGHFKYSIYTAVWDSQWDIWNGSFLKGTGEETWTLKPYGIYETALSLTSNQDVTASTEYMFLAWGEDSSSYGGLKIRYDTTDNGNDFDSTYGNWAATYDGISEIDRYSIYCTYSAGGGEEEPTKKQDIIWFD
jgi:hypothetical protein